MEHLQHKPIPQALAPSPSLPALYLNRKQQQQQSSPPPQSLQEKQQPSVDFQTPGHSSEFSKESLNASEALSTATPRLSSKLQPPRKAFYFSPPTSSYDHKNLPVGVTSSPERTSKRQGTQAHTQDSLSSPGICALLPLRQTV